jgi:hypothetical protein
MPTGHLLRRAYESANQPPPQGRTNAALRPHKPKPALAASRHPPRTTAAATRDHARRGQRTRRRRFAQQRTQRKAPRTGLAAQRDEERLEPGTDAVHRTRLAPLLGERTRAGGMMTQRSHQMTTRGTRCLDGGAGKTGAQESVHGFGSGRRAARREVPQKTAPSMPADTARTPQIGPGRAAAAGEGRASRKALGIAINMRAGYTRFVTSESPF